MEQTDLLQLSDYLAGDLTETERAAVEQRLRTDAEFAALFQAQKTQKELLVAIHRAETKARLREQFQAQQQPQPARSRRLWLGAALAIAASVLLLLWLAPWQSGPSLQELALAELEPYPLTVERGDGTSLNQAQLAYQAGNYEAALPLFTAWLKENPGDDAARLYQAECWSLTGQYTEAAAALRQIATNSPYGDAVQWRLALNLILAGSQPDGEAILRDIQQRAHYKNRAAETLLQKLENGQ